MIRSEAGHKCVSSGALWERSGANQHQPLSLLCLGPLGMSYKVM